MPEHAENGVGSTEADGCSIVEKGVVATEFNFGLKLIQDLFHPRHIHLTCGSVARFLAGREDLYPSRYHSFLIPFFFRPFN